MFVGGGENVCYGVIGVIGGVVYGERWVFFEIGCVEGEVVYFDKVESRLRDFGVFDAVGLRYGVKNR